MLRPLFIALAIVGAGAADTCGAAMPLSAAAIWSTTSARAAIAIRRAGHRRGWAQPRTAAVGRLPDLQRAVFTVKGSNLTPDRDTGHGAWSARRYQAALTEGVRPSGVPLAMVDAVELPPRAHAAAISTRSSPISARCRPSATRCSRRSTRWRCLRRRVPGGRAADDGRRAQGSGEAGLLSRCRSPIAWPAIRAASEDVPADFKNAWGKGGRVFKGPFGESTARQHLRTQGERPRRLDRCRDQAGFDRRHVEGRTPAEAADDRLRRLLQDLERQRDRRR